MPKAAAISKILPSLLVSDSDQRLLRELAVSLATHNLDMYNALQLTRDGHPDTRRWTTVRKIEGIRIYRERSGSVDTSLLPSLLLLGSVVGNLDDIMYGNVAPTDESMKIKSSCIQDGITDSKVLQELVNPTVDDPFHHVSIQWRLYESRDYVTLDTTGIMLTASGERVGYSISHSVDFPQLPELTALGVVRGGQSVCSLYRQATDRTIECYTRGFFDLKRVGSSSSNAALQAVATRWLSFSRNIQCAQMKKLAWRLRKNAGCAEVVGFTLPQKNEKPVDATCRVCARSLSFLPGMRKTCKSCCHAVCSRCCVKKLMCTIAPDQVSVLEKKRTFCSQCIHEVVKSDAAAIARDELETLHRDSDPVEFSL